MTPAVTLPRDEHVAVALDRVPTDFDWANGGLGRRLECPRCRTGFEVHVPARWSVCASCRELLVLVLDGPASVPRSPQRPRNPRRSANGAGTRTSASPNPPAG